MVAAKPYPTVLRQETLLYHRANSSTQLRAEQHLISALSKEWLIVASRDRLIFSESGRDAVRLKILPVLCRVWLGSRISRRRDRNARQIRAGQNFAELWQWQRCAVSRWTCLYLLMKPMRACRAKQATRTAETGTVAVTGCGVELGREIWY